VTYILTLNVTLNNTLQLIKYLHELYYTLKNAGLFQPKFGSNMDKPKCWVKNVIKKKIQLKLG